MIGALKKASDLAYEAAKWLMFVYILGVTVLAIVGVFFRTIGSSLSWNEELMRWLLIGLAYIGASVGLRTRNHIGIEFFILRMSKTMRRTSILIGYAAITVFLLIVLWYGFEAALNARRQYGAILRLPMVWVKMNLPLGSLFMLIHMSYFSAGVFQEKGDNLRQYLISGGQDHEGEGAV